MTDDVLFHRRPRDLAMTDIRLAMRPEGVLTDRRGYAYLVYARSSRALRTRALAFDETAAEPARRVADYVVAGLTCSFYLTAIWYGFFVL
jgi:hypothetical protein